jgi:hypothetical protein
MTKAEAENVLISWFAMRITSVFELLNIIGQDTTPDEMATLARAFLSAGKASAAKALMTRSKELKAERKSK